MQSQEERDAANALKAIARNLSLKSYVQHKTDLYAVLWAAARRFVAGETREDGIHIADVLSSQNYRVSLECIGENTASEQECSRVVDEFISLSQAIAASGLQEATLSLDLSHIGLSVSKGLALDSLHRLVEEVGQRGQSLMIGMEESDKGQAILDIYQQVAARAPHVGITIPAHMYRTEQDLDLLLSLPGKIRLVKGAYQEPADRALSRGEILDDRYLELLRRIFDVNHPLSIATHDEKLLSKVTKHISPGSPNVEIEMLYGIRPDLLRHYKAAGYRTRIYLAYGTEWYLYLCHRLAEYPPNIYQALADCVDPARTNSPAQDYR